MPNIYNSGANYSYSASPTSGTIVPSGNTIRTRMANGADPSYVPPSQRMSNFGNVFNPSNANAMDYSLYSNYYSPYPTKSLAALVADEQGRLQTLGPSEYDRLGRIGMPTTGIGWDPNFNAAAWRGNKQASGGGGTSVSMAGGQDPSFEQRYNQNLQNILNGITNGTMVW